MFSLATPPLFARLRAARTVLIAGAGGGFDVFAGIPLGVALRQQGKNVHYASLSFSDLERLDLDAWLERGLAAVDLDALARGVHYLPLLENTRTALTSRSRSRSTARASRNAVPGAHFLTDAAPPPR